ncbi:MAG TPA: SufE family protein [Ignavibacteriaceae bacterium]|nr:SufE family protein [Ignavibacteriaceae bacterium]
MKYLNFMSVKLLYISVFWITINGHFKPSPAAYKMIAEPNLIYSNHSGQDSLEEKNNLPPKLNEMLEKFSGLKNKTEKINLLIEYADKFKEVPPEVAVRPFPDENEVQFCESGAYVWTRLQINNTLKFYFAVENPQGVSARALSAILDISLTGETPADVLTVPDDIVLKIFGEDLLKGKNMGLVGILQKVKNDAKKFLE